MTEIVNDVRDKLRRSLSQEFIRMEDDFDLTRRHRSELVEKLVTSAKSVILDDGQGNVKEATDTGLRVITTALKALTDVEKASATSISLKLRQSEQDIAASAAAKDRLAVVLHATAPGRIQESFPTETLEAHLSEMFDADIKEFETKTDNKDLDSE